MNGPEVSPDDDTVPLHIPAALPGVGLSGTSAEPPTTGTVPIIKPADEIKFFGTKAFRRLWFAQVASALGDWIGLVAITALATRVGGGDSGSAVALVLAFRIAPSIFFSPVAGMIVDRWDRKRVMVVCDIGRALVVGSLVYVDTIGGLIFASFLLEIFTLFGMPAKEATVPRIVSRDFLPRANSLSLVAAYGTFPLGAAAFAILTKVSEWARNDDALGFDFNKYDLAFLADAGTFLISALLVAGLAVPRHGKRKIKQIPLNQTLQDMKEGLTYIKSRPRVRTVIIGLAAGLFGGAMVVPLGSVFANRVLGAGEAGFGLFVTALGLGVAFSVVTLSFLQRRVAADRLFAYSIIAAGLSVFAAASSSSLGTSATFIGVLGLCAGAVYVLGFSILHADVHDEVRGRTFVALYTTVRANILLAFVVAPLLADVLDRDPELTLSFGVVEMALPGVRLTLWIGAFILLGTGLWVWRTLTSVARHSADA